MPIVYQRVKGASEHVVYRGKDLDIATTQTGTNLNTETSNALLQRINKIHHIVVKLGDEFSFLG